MSKGCKRIINEYKDVIPEMMRSLDSVSRLNTESAAEKLIRTCSPKELMIVAGPEIFGGKMAI